MNGSRAPLRAVATGVLLTFVLDRLGGRRGGPAVAAPEAREPLPAPARRGPLLAVAVGSLLVGLALMLPFEAVIARVVGVLALFAFVVSGVFLVAAPAFIGDDPT